MHVPSPLPIYSGVKSTINIIAEMELIAALLDCLQLQSQKSDHTFLNLRTFFNGENLCTVLNVSLSLQCPPQHNKLFVQVRHTISSDLNS